ncbi:hypothetical protein M3B11_12880 [Brevibacterium sp. p3-SID960]|uniref:hypothetical protein n=1 Tax=Brevibacterium sp. p3-SID960 TaxID=2916063 RepID=UPI0021A890F9|nr:hypothetical protein [Brevibacterium sp. p3-SID960]MCT1691829.1 hypothetical protein [Brevibacterium sp. p3-SID960]
MSRAVSETRPSTAGVTGRRWRGIARVAVLFALSALFLTGWFWGYTGVLLVMLLISAVQFIRDRRAHPSAAAAETADLATSNRPDCTGQWS